MSVSWIARFARVALGLAALAAALGSAAQPARPDLEEAVRLIVAGTNEFRASVQQAPLARDGRLTAAAADFARHMARTDRYSHEADGRTPAERVVAKGYDYCVVLENIAYVQSSAGFRTTALAQRLVTGWKESPGHRRNMLDPDVTQTGVALAQSEQTGRFYAVQLFGRPQSSAFRFSVANQSDSAVHYELGDKGFDLSPGMTRTHEECLAQRLAVRAGAGTGGAPWEAQPASGDAFVVHGDRAGALRVERRQGRR